MESVSNNDSSILNLSASKVQNEGLNMSVNKFIKKPMEIETDLELGRNKSRTFIKHGSQANKPHQLSYTERNRSNSNYMYSSSQISPQHRNNEEESLKILPTRSIYGSHHSHKSYATRKIRLKTAQNFDQEVSLLKGDN